jgi:hypothetical protein
MLSLGLVHDELIARDLFCNILQINPKRLPPQKTLDSIKVTYDDFAQLYLTS